MVIPAGLFWLLLRTIPESPRWLILQHRDAEAIPVMQRLGEANVAKVIDDIRNSVAHTTEQLFQRKYRKPILFAVLLAMFNQLSGINAIIYYAPRIFEMAGFDKAHAYLQPIYIGAANLFFTLLAMSVIDKFGRKTLLLIGSVGMILFLALTASAFRGSVAGNHNVIIYLIGFIAFFAFSQGAVIWVFISEIFPNSVRSQGGSLGSFTHWIMAALISWTFPVIVEGSKQGGFYSFIFYSCMMLLHLIFVWRFLPETKGKSLESIQKQLGIE
jgi:sugar porter (SP) family MFS transporter